MPREYPPLTTVEVRRILKASGFIKDRTRGSHEQWVMERNGRLFTVTVDASYQTIDDIDLLQSYIRQSGMTREEFYGSTDHTARKIANRRREPENTEPEAPVPLFQIGQRVTLEAPSYKQYNGKVACVVGEPCFSVPDATKRIGRRWTEELRWLYAIEVEGEAFLIEECIEEWIVILD